MSEGEHNCREHFGIFSIDGDLPIMGAHRDICYKPLRDNFWTATEEALSRIYGVVRKLVGDQFFTLMVDHFLRSFPPRHGNVHQLGGDLPAFLHDFSPVSNLPYLSDIARLEWVYHQVFHAAPAKPFNTRALTKVAVADIPQLHFKMATTSQLVYSPFPIFQIWRVNQPDYEGDQSVDLDTGGESVLLTRPGLVVELHKLGQCDARFLQSLVAPDDL